QIREEALGALVEIYAERDQTFPLSRFLESFSDEYDRASVPPYTNVDPAAYQALASALSDEQKAIRQEAAYALGILDGKSQVKALGGALQDPDPGVRGAARRRARRCARCTRPTGGGSWACACSPAWPASPTRHKATFSGSSCRI